MNKYVITCSSTADLNEEYLKKREIPYANFTFYVNDVGYKDDYGKSYDRKKFYNDIRNGAKVSTSQVNSESYIAMFEPFLKEGYDILHISLSSGISGTVNSANNAAEEMKEKYPERKVIVIDSLCCSTGYGYLLNLAIDNQEAGMSLEDNANWLEENKTKVIHWFTSTDLSSYIRGGRISKVAGAFGTALQICPVMTVSKEGKLEMVEKARTKKKALKVLADKMLEEVGSSYDGYCFINHSDCLEDAQTLKTLIQENCPKVKEPQIYDVGFVIGSHTGPGTIAFYYTGKERVK